MSTSFTPVSIRRLSTGSVYKLVFIGMLSVMLPLGLLMGLMAWAGMETVHWQGTAVYGLGGLVAAVLVSLWVVLAFTAMTGSFMALGLWLYSRFKPLQLLIRREPAGTGDE